MKRLIIVCGLPGSGKTTLARELSKKLNIICLHKDFIKESLYEIMGGSSLEESKEIGNAVSKLMLRLPEEYLKNSVDLIIESPFNYPEDYSVFRKWQKKYKTKIYSIICYINDIERKKRFRNRPRHQAHHDALRKFEKNNYNYSGIPGKKIRVITNKPVREIVKRIIKEIK